MTISLILAAAAAASQPSAEALELARQVAAQGMLAQIAPVQTQSEVDQMIKDHPELSEPERKRLREIGQAHARALLDKVLDSEAGIIAGELSLEDLRAIVAFGKSPAAEHQRAALPKVMIGTVAALGKVDYAGGVRAAFCGETRKLCDKK
jgi:hypothetical protein